MMEMAVKYRPFRLKCISSALAWLFLFTLLYTLSAKLSGANGYEVVSWRFGCRQVEIRGSEFLINGVPVKLRGANHYEVDPLGGTLD
jgi:beta-galactosidase